MNAASPVVKDDKFSVAVIVPVYNHARAIAAMVEGIVVHGAHCLLVDDGSDGHCASVLDALVAQHAGRVSLLRLETNQGKGGAVATGLLELAGRGYTHALQIDADGQHDPADIPAFIAAAGNEAAAVICGYPIFDHSVPKGRLYGRYATHVWVWINTLSLDIKDSMCGYRVYPLGPTIALLQSRALGKRMDFDSEVLVRLHWRGIPVRNRPTRVSYPADGVSHFKLWHDNLLISRMHAILFFGMLLRLPVLLSRKWQSA